MHKVLIIYFIFQSCVSFANDLLVKVDKGGIQFNDESIDFLNLKNKFFYPLEYEKSKGHFDSDVYRLNNYPISFVYYTRKSGEIVLYINVSWDKYRNNYTDISLELHDKYYFSNNLSPTYYEKLLIQEGIKFSKYDSELNLRYDSSCDPYNQNIASVKFAKNGWLKNRITTKNGFMNISLQFKFK